MSVKYDFGLAQHAILVEKNTNKLYSFGENYFGQLGLGYTTRSVYKTLINYSFNGTPINIQLGEISSFVLTDTGKVYSFGDNQFGQLGIGNTTQKTTPTLINYTFSGKPIKIQCGGNHSIILTDTNKVYSFGRNDYGQLGLGDTTNRNTPTLLDFQFNGNPVSIQQGRFHSMILTDTGKVYSFGDNQFGQLGLGDTNNRTTPTLINYSFSGKPIKIQCGGNHSFVLTSTAKIYNAGHNGYGQLGFGDTINRNTLTLLNYSFDGLPLNIQQGYWHSLILTDTGKIYSFGWNRDGMLGLGDTTNRNIPTLLNYSFDGTPISVQQGRYNSFIFTNTNKVYSFGYNNVGQLGFQDISNRSIPTLIPNFEVLVPIPYKLLLYKDNNYYYQNTDDGSINLIGPIVSYEDFENYGIENILDMINIPNIINNNYSILQYREYQISSSNINSQITYIPNNQLIKMQDYIFTQDFSNIDKITLNQSNLNILNNELKNINEITKFIIPNYGIDNNLNLTYKNKEKQNTINELESGFYVKSYNINDIKQKYNNLVQFEN